MSNNTAQGACLCGAIRFTIGLPTIWVAHCHCTQCQRAHGAAFVTWVGAATERFKCDDPQGVLRWFASSKEAERGFCSRCGSSLFFRSSSWPGETHIARANFSTPLDREPQQHGYYDSRVEWFEVNDALPKKPAPP